MEMRIIYYNIYVSCVFIISYVDCRTFSLNDVIATEHSSQVPENFIVTGGNLISQTKKTSSLKYKKTFQIPSPSKPKKLKHLQGPRNKRKKLTSKREVQHNEQKNIKYIPLLRNIGMLFDNILSSGSSENDSRKYKRKRNPFINDDGDDSCSCARKQTEYASNSRQTTTFTPSSSEVESEVTSSAIITTTPSYNLASNNFSSIGRNKIVPLLLARNSLSFRRNNNGFSPGSGTTHNGSPERHITRVHGNNLTDSGETVSASNNKYNEEDTDGNTRHDTDSDYELGGTIPGNGRSTQHSTTNRGSAETKEFIFTTNDSTEDAPEHVLEHERENKFEIRRNETESPIFLPKFTSRLREYNAQKESISIQTPESDEKIVAFDLSSNKRISNRNGTDTTKDKKNGRTNKTVELLSKSNYPVGKVVMVYDGYSIARDVNGENKLSEKAIHIHS